MNENQSEPRSLEQIKAAIAGVLAQKLREAREEEGLALIHDLEAHLPDEADHLGHDPSLAAEIQGDLGETLAELQGLENRLASIAAYDEASSRQRFQDRERELLERAMKQLLEIEPTFDEVTQQVRNVHHLLEPWLSTTVSDGPEPGETKPAKHSAGEALIQMASMVPGIYARLAESKAVIQQIHLLSFTFDIEEKDRPDLETSE